MVQLFHANACVLVLALSRPLRVAELLLSAVQPLSSEVEALLKNEELAFQGMPLNTICHAMIHINTVYCYFAGPQP